MTIFQQILPPGSGSSVEDPDTHIIRQALVVAGGAIVTITSPAIVAVHTDNAGRSLTVSAPSTIEFT